jgi:hypothetical protein
MYILMASAIASPECFSLALNVCAERLIKRDVMDPDSVGFVSRGISDFLGSQCIDCTKTTVSPFMPYASLIDTYTHGSNVCTEYFAIDLIEDRRVHMWCVGSEIITSAPVRLWLKLNWGRTTKL